MGASPGTGDSLGAFSPENAQGDRTAIAVVKDVRGRAGAEERWG